MADRYQDRPYGADGDDDRGEDPHAPDKADSDPLAELARLIGQTDPFGSMGRANLPLQPRPPPQYQDPAPVDEDVAPAPGPPPWMQRAHRAEAPPQDYEQDVPAPVHPLKRYATSLAPPAPEYQAPLFAEGEHESDPSRYDEALYGQLATDEQEPGAAYADDAYAYQDGYDEAADEPPAPKRGGGMATVIVVLALAVLGTGAAFAYRTYVGSPRIGEPPIIKADTGPTKIIPTPPDGSGKVPDRLAAGDGTEKIVPREEAPVDVNPKPVPRVVLPQMNPNGVPIPAAAVPPPAPPPAAGNGVMPNAEPRKIKTLTVRGDQPDPAAQAAGAAPSAAPAKPAPAARAATAPAAAPRSPTNANASSTNAPLSLVPQGTEPAAAAEPRTRVAATTTTPVQNPPSASTGGGGYVVQVSSQRNEADAQASYKALQGKFPAVLGSRAPLIKRADLGDKGVYYRAMVGPFGSPDEASQFCGSLKTAGGQCVVQRN